MYARVVRFTDVDPGHLAERLSDVESSGRPPVDIRCEIKAELSPA